MIKMQLTTIWMQLLSHISNLHIKDIDLQSQKDKVGDEDKVEMSTYH